MKEKIKDVMAAVFMCDATQINENSNRETIKEWDSLRHMNLIVALEEEFGITFTDEETIEMMNYKLIVETIQNKKI